MKKFMISLVLLVGTAISANADEYVYLYPCSNGDVIMMQTDVELTVEELEAWYAYAEKDAITIKTLMYCVSSIWTHNTINRDSLSFILYETQILYLAIVRSCVNTGVVGTDDS